MDSLKSCPLCGGNAKLVKAHFGETRSVMCLECGLMTAVHKTVEDAINRWNIRANEIPVGNGENYTMVVSENAKI